MLKKCPFLIFGTQRFENYQADHIKISNRRIGNTINKDESKHKIINYVKITNHWNISKHVSVPA